MELIFDKINRIVNYYLNSSLFGDRLMVGLQFLVLPIGVRSPVSEPEKLPFRVFFVAKNK